MVTSFTLVWIKIMADLNEVYSWLVTSFTLVWIKIEDERSCIPRR